MDALVNEAKITLGGKDYPLMLSTRAVMEISKKFGGLSNMGNLLSKDDNSEKQLESVIWLITLLANQPILIHNHFNKNDQRELLTEEDVLLLTTPGDLKEMNSAIKIAMERGSSRNIQSASSKNI